jgi:hypothetical protein
MTTPSFVTVIAVSTQRHGRITTEEEGPRQGGRLDGGRKAMTMDDDTAILMIRMRRIIATKVPTRRIFGREFNPKTRDYRNCD